MKTFSKILASALIATSLAGCHEIETWQDDAYGNFDALWTVLDEHYCFFEEKDIDWKAVGQEYRAKITPETTEKELFYICADMLDELKDGHTNLISWFDVSYYRKWWSDYPQNFNWRLIQENYLDFDYVSGGAMSYKILKDANVGYVYYSSFSSAVSNDFVNNMLYDMKDCNGLIIDVRNNGGGNLTNVEAFASHFITEKTLAGYICHKTGPGHNDFSEPYAFSFEPVMGVRWLKPVIVLANRSTFSAANNFVSVMKGFEHVRICGTTTGGGSGAPFSSEIPCGWSVRFSGSPIYDAEMHLTEHGVAPSPGFEKQMSPEDEAAGHDSILDFAIEVLKSTAPAPAQ